VADKSEKNMIQTQEGARPVRLHHRGRIIAINSDAFLSTFEDWNEIDSGFGDKYHHAQGNYFDKSLMDDRRI